MSRRPYKLTMLRSTLPELEFTVPIAKPIKDPTWRTGLSPSARGYDRRWQKFREHWLRKHPLCGDREDGPSSEHSQCRREGRYTPALQVDHIKPHRGDKQAFWAGPFQSLCPSCHSAKTQQED